MSLLLQDLTACSTARASSPAGIGSALLLEF
jgi:hypothetical protein